MCIGVQFLDQDSREENPNKASISKFESLAANIEMQQNEISNRKVPKSNILLFVDVILFL